MAEKEEETEEKEMEERKERKPFQSDDVREDVMGYARKLKALGEVWGTLSWHEGVGHVSSDTLETCGEELGSIIKDYAEAIEIMFENDQCLFVGCDKYIVFPIADHQEAFEWLSKTPDQQDIYLVGYHLSKLKEFRQGAVMSVFDLISKFEDLLKKKQKKAPTAVAAAAEA